MVRWLLEVIDVARLRVITIGRLAVSRAHRDHDRVTIASGTHTYAHQLGVGCLPD